MKTHKIKKKSVDFFRIIIKIKITDLKYGKAI